MNAIQEIERSETRDGIIYRLQVYAGLWVAKRGDKPLCAPSSYDFAYERFLAGKRTDE